MRTFFLIVAVVSGIVACDEQMLPLENLEKQYSKITKKACEKVNAATDEAFAIVRVAKGLTDGAAIVTTATGVTVVSHSSSAWILTGPAGYVAGTIGTPATATLGVLTAPATIAATTVSVIAVSGAVLVCR